MAVEKKTALGPITYPVLKTVYGVFGFGLGFAAGGAIGAGLSLIATGASEGIVHVLGSPIPPGQDFESVLLKVGIPVSAVAGLIGGGVESSSALAEFNRDFTRKPSRRS